MLQHHRLTHAVNSDDWSKSKIRPFKDKPTLEIINSIAVYQMCAIPGLVKITPYILSTAAKLRIQRPLHWIVRKTFFRHFCGKNDFKRLIRISFCFVLVFY